MRTDTASPLDLPLHAGADDASVLLESLQRANDRGDHAGVDAMLAKLEARADLPVPLAVHAHAAASQSLYRRNLPERAAERAAAALEFARGCGDVSALCAAQIAWARIEWMAGHADAALRHLEEAALDMPEDLRQQSDLHNLLGLVHADLGRLERSENHHRQALAAARSSGLVDLQIATLSNLAARLMSTAERMDAEGQPVPPAAWAELDRLCAEAEQLAQQHGRDAALPHVLATAGEALLQRGRLDDALAVLTRQRTLVERQFDRSSLPYAAQLVARLHQRQGRIEAARAALADGIAEAERLAARARQAALHLEASTLEEAMQDDRAALFHYKRFHALRERCAAETAHRRTIALALRRTLGREAAEPRDGGIRLAAQETPRRRADDLSRQALLDPLTGIGNRRMLELRLPQLHAECRRAGLPLSLVMFDLDQLRKVNERFSPAVGDEVLRTLGRLLASQFRAGDLCARVGGEEFLLAFPGLDEKGCMSLCERLRKQIAAHPWHLVRPELAVTISLGAADIAGSASVTEGLQLAERRLREAKGAGGNRVVTTLLPAGGTLPH